MDSKNTTIRISDMSLWPEAQHTSHAVHTLTIRMVLPNAWSVQSLKRTTRWWLTPSPWFSSGEKQLIPQSISIRDRQIKAWKEVTAMAIKHSTKRHTKCCMHLENLRTMPTVTRYHIKVLSTTYTDWDSTQADASLKSSAEANSAQDQSPAWW